MQNATKIGKGNNAEAIDNKDSDAAAKISLESHNFLTDMEDLVKATTFLTGDDLNAAKAKINDLIASGKKSVESVRISMGHRAQKTAAVTNAYVHNQPWQAIGIGVVFGLVLGYLLPRRS
jgi:ElaB/YqjD/DUF883 family membrane-anchored ribosome-binding protein